MDIRFKTALALVSFSVFCNATSLAEQFHVAQTAVGASDENNGLSAVYVSGNHGPWLTMQHSAYTAQSGDTVLVHDGDYRDEDTGWGGPGIIALVNSGTAVSSIKFEAAAGSKPLINRFRIHNVQWIEIEGFTMESPDFQLPLNWADMPKVIVDDPDVEIDFDQPYEIREPDVRQKYSTYMGMLDFFLANYTTGVDILDSQNITVRGNQISLYTFGIQARGNSTQITIEKNFISYCLDGIFTWDPSPALTDSVIRYNTIRQSFNNGMQIRQGSDNVLVEGNDVRFSGTSHIIVQNQCTNCTVRSNIGMHAGGYTETMEFPGSSAFSIHTSLGGIIVERNLAAFQIDVTGGDGNGFIVDLMLQESGVLMRNNIAFRNMGSGIRTVASPNCYIANNTLANNGYNAVNLRAGAGVYLANEDDLNTTIVNNIFYKNSAAAIKSFFTIDQQTLIEHNLYYGAAGVPLIWDGWLFDQNVYNTMSEIQIATGWEEKGINADPRFARSRSRDRHGFPAMNFRLSSRSPAINRGMTVSQVDNDFVGRLRPAGSSHDIGAFEKIKD